MSLLKLRVPEQHRVGWRASTLPLVRGKLPQSAQKDPLFCGRSRVGVWDPVENGVLMWGFSEPV